MKKIIVVVGIIFMFMCNYNATETSGTVCDYKKQDANSILAQAINYKTSFNIQTHTFNITFYNVVPDLVLSYYGSPYVGDSEYKAFISSIPEGESMEVAVYSTNTGCNYSLMTIYVNLPYYNDYYGSEKCKDYQELLTVCSSKFLDYEMNDIILESAINNYNEKKANEGDKNGPENKTFLESVGSFMMNWGIKILLIGTTIGLSIWLYRVKFRKIKHGI